MSTFLIILGHDSRLGLFVYAFSSAAVMWNTLGAIDYREDRDQVVFCATVESLDYNKKF